MNTRISRILLVYTLVVSTLAAGALVTQAIGAQSKASFDEIDVRRINLREEDGTLRLVISNTHRLPGIIHKGKEMPHPNRRTAGMLFFNEEGTENGGLSFSGRTENGKVSSSGHLSFDQYEQDQVIQITQTENNGVRRATFGVADRPDKSSSACCSARWTTAAPRCICSMQRNGRESACRSQPKAPRQ